ncbi:actin, putative [Eimeria tenella]|uniref:Actin, putative n=1 Tax=Eimeria tenella TaxID=5802 RepID=U6KLL3_EIMTE|nr:actin, putative [Eimeria tenella]CDJ38972.1 actin, putative [Eimeria tenella]|eukprot:XP_013229727.1 actin, putative [Eimeria tenella]
MASVFEEVIANQPLVIDNGTGLLKTGFAGDDTPKAICPTFVGRPKHKRVMAGAAEGDVFVGPKAEAMRGLLRLRYPMRHGIVEDWLDMETLWGFVFSNLNVNSEEHPVLLTESALNPRRQREKAAEIFFETFNSPALFFSAQPILALYSSGRTTGLVLDCGAGVSHAVPVVEGFSLAHAVLRADLGGRDVTERLAILLRRAGHIFHTSAEFEIVRQIKEQACYVAFNPQKEEITTQDKSGGGYPFQLPDGTTISVGAERYRAPEILFHPSLVGLEYPGVHELVVNSISRADLDLRRTLFSQIVLAGGSTYFHGFGDRLLNEIRKAAPKDIKIRISAPPERKFSTWIGGSILASLSSFKKMWVPRQEYEECGPSILHRKTL